MVGAMDTTWLLLIMDVNADADVFFFFLPFNCWHDDDDDDDGSSPRRLRRILNEDVDVDVDVVQEGSFFWDDDDMMNILIL